MKKIVFNATLVVNRQLSLEGTPSEIANTFGVSEEAIYAMYEDELEEFFMNKIYEIENLAVNGSRSSEVAVDYNDDVFDEVFEDLEVEEE